MDWYYAESGQQVGPVTSERLDQLRATGKITPVTLVWKEGMAEWQPYGNVFAAPPPGSAAAPALAVCAECGNSFKRDDMIPYQNPYVCAKVQRRIFRRGTCGAKATSWSFRWELNCRRAAPNAARLSPPVPSDASSIGIRSGFIC